MFGLIKQVFTVLLSFCESFTRVTKVSDKTKCLSLNDGPNMVRLTLIDLNPVELKYYQFMISFDKCSGSCIVFSHKIVFLKK